MLYKNDWIIIIWVRNLFHRSPIHPPPRAFIRFSMRPERCFSHTAVVLSYPPPPSQSLSASISVVFKALCACRSAIPYIYICVYTMCTRIRISQQALIYILIVEFLRTFPFLDTAVRPRQLSSRPSF